MRRVLAALGAPYTQAGGKEGQAVDHSHCNVDLHPTSDGFRLGIDSPISCPKACGLATCRCDRGRLSGKNVVRSSHGRTGEDSPASSQTARQGRRLVGFWKKRIERWDAGRGTIEPKSAVSRAVTNDLPGAGAGITSTPRTFQRHTILTTY